MVDGRCGSREIKAAGGEAIAAVGSIAEEKDVQAMVDVAVQEYGTLDVWLTMQALWTTLNQLERSLTRCGTGCWQ